MKTLKTLLLGKGYIGNYLATAKTTHEIHHFSKAEKDYTKDKEFTALIDEIKPDWIINTTGYTGKPNVDACEADAWNCYHYNVTVPLHLTQIANKHSIPIIHIGSGCIYTGYEKIFTEQDPSNFGVEQLNSSFYSKTKDAFEKLSSNMKRYIFRIRIPFNGVPESKNYLWKLLHYNDLINMQNSLTNVDELANFTFQFIEKEPELGIYNVLNKGTVNAKTVVDLLKLNGLNNPNWNFVDIEKANFKVERSNCHLSTEKIKKLDLELQPILVSLSTAVQQYRFAIEQESE